MPTAIDAAIDASRLIARRIKPPSCSLPNPHADCATAVMSTRPSAACVAHRSCYFLPRASGSKRSATCKRAPTQFCSRSSKSATALIQRAKHDLEQFVSVPRSLHSPLRWASCSSSSPSRTVASNSDWPRRFRHSTDDVACFSASASRCKCNSATQIFKCRELLQATCV